MKKALKKEIIIWSLIFLFGISLLITEIYRAKIGYFSNGILTFLSSVFYMIFFGLVIGLVVNKAVRKLR